MTESQGNLIYQKLHNYSGTSLQRMSGDRQKSLLQREICYNELPITTHKSDVTRFFTIFPKNQISLKIQQTEQNFYTAHTISKKFYTHTFLAKIHLKNQNLGFFGWEKIHCNQLILGQNVNRENDALQREIRCIQIRCIHTMYVLVVIGKGRIQQ
eukprot:TRINITY_DN8837_c2_g1_i2.p2 TRINITY_DN8837_c2_g1~~TRINITY_DN8837_c2_g1_i2.p2  ORF type:complete len:155 (+),score=0.55 TRINITY_DN8837_c2_g1_i2:62-526(+)